jgi:hypothetical protein
MSDRGDLELLLRSGVPILLVETSDEARFLGLLTQIALDSPKADYRPLYRWTVTDGLQRLDLALEPQRHAVEPQDVLGHIRAVTKPGIFALLDSPIPAGPRQHTSAKDIALAHARAVIILSSHRIAAELGFRAFRAVCPVRRAASNRAACRRQHQDSQPNRRVAVTPRR